MSKKKQKKKARITNRQAKIRQKKKKPSKPFKAKFRRLQQKVENGFKQKGISTEGIEFRDSPDGVKMSEVILNLADPLLKQFGDNDKRIKTIISLTIFEWNRLMLPEDEREKFQNEMFDILLSPGDDADMIGSILNINQLIAERQKKYFSDIKKIIFDYELIVADGNITLNISSAPAESNRSSK